MVFLLYCLSTLMYHSQRGLIINATDGYLSCRDDLDICICHKTSCHLVQSDSISMVRRRMLWHLCCGAIFSLLSSISLCTRCIERLGIGQPFIREPSLVLSVTMHRSFKEFPFLTRTQTFCVKVDYNMLTIIVFLYCSPFLFYFMTIHFLFFIIRVKHSLQN